MQSGLKTIVVEIDGASRMLDPGEELTFGRDLSCTVCLGDGDVGISRVAGRIRVEGGVWCVTNLSRKRPLHVVDGQGFTIPLPVKTPGWPSSRRVVDQPQLTVLIPGSTWTHAMTLRTAAVRTIDPPPAPQNPISTLIPTLLMTDDRREVLVALIRGYLQQHPRYDPRPRGYDDTAALLGVTRTEVIRRVEEVRRHLAEAGVEGLDETEDVRRPLCEWLLAMRLVTPADLDWLAARIGPQDPQAVARSKSAGPSTSEFGRTPRARVTHATHLAAAAITPPLRARLVAAYGENWLDAVNATRAARHQPRVSSLDDERICLALLAHDRAIVNWAPPDVRGAARALKSLADAAAHNRPLPADVTLTAHNHAERLRRWAATHP